MSSLNSGTQSNLSPRKFCSGKLLPLAAAVAFSFYGPAHGATIVVNDATAGSVTSNCTIVDAVTAVNTQAAVNGCNGGDGMNDTIDLTTFTSATTISFVQAAAGNTHALALTKAVTIQGALDQSGNPLVTLERSSVSGTPNFGLINSTAVLAIDSLTLQNGYAPTGYLGGGILAGSSLSVSNSVISGNSSSAAGGGIAAFSGLTVTQTVLTGNTAGNAGGGIYSNLGVSIYGSILSGNSTTSSSGQGGGAIFTMGAATIVRSTVANNTSATNGGGVAGPVDLTQSTVSGNIAQAGAGGGVYATGSGAGVDRSTINGNTAATTGGGISATDAELTNSTLTGNIASGAGGGIYAQTVTLTYATVFANTSSKGVGGGANFVTTATVNGTILAGNSPDDLNTASQSAATGSYDLIQISPWGVPTGTKTCDPNLGPLTNNGGTTQTLALMSGSCAIDAASMRPSETIDQRGYTRPAAIGTNPYADIGAYEAGSSDPDVIFTNGFESTGT
jgi:predicted outer membrane repeat protein